MEAASAVPSAGEAEAAGALPAGALLIGVLPAVALPAGGAAVVGVAAGLLTRTPEVASQPHGSVMVTGTGVLPQPVLQVLVVTVNPGGMWSVAVAQTGVASGQVSVTV